MPAKWLIENFIVSNSSSNASMSCPICGHILSPDQPVCPYCTAETEGLGATATLKLDREPTVIPRTQGQTIEFTADAHVVLQLLPSGACLSLPVRQPTLLGRLDISQAESAYPLIDLTAYGAEQHGVSRHHCLLKRHNDRLFLTDLGSTNSTYLNGERLIPFAETLLADSDKLILGTLHLILFFVTNNTP